MLLEIIIGIYNLVHMSLQPSCTSVVLFSKYIFNYNLFLDMPSREKSLAASVSIVTCKLRIEASLYTLQILMWRQITIRQSNRKVRLDEYFLPMFQMIVLHMLGELYRRTLDIRSGIHFHKTLYE